MKNQIPIPKFNNNENSFKKIKFHRPNKSIEFKKIKKLKLDYKDPSFFHNTNIENEKNSLITIFQKIKNSKNETIRSENHPFNTITNFPTITTEKSTLTFRETKNKNINEDIKNYDKIFKRKKIWKKKKINSIDNLLNIKYAENEKQYLKLAEKENKKRVEKGFPKKKFTLSKFTENQIQIIKINLGFIKSIEDYVLPIFSKLKTRALSNDIKEKNKIKENYFISPSHKRVLKNKEYKSERNLFLTKTISIN